MAKSKKPESLPEADDQTKGPDASEAAEIEENTGAEASDTEADRKDTTETPTETPLETPDVSEAEALSVAEPEPALDETPPDAADDDQPADADSVAATEAATAASEDATDIEAAAAMSAALPEGTGAAPEIDAVPAGAPVVRETVVERKGGFLPTLLGGILAAAAGFGLSQYLGGDLFGDNDAFAEETRAALSEQTNTLDALNGRIEGLAQSIPEIDLTSIETAIAGLSARSEELGGTVGALSDRLSALEDNANALGARLSEVEKAPVAEAVSPAAIEAYEQEIARLREEVEATLSDVEVQREEIASIAERAMAAERSAETRATKAELRTAVASLTAEVDAGRPFADALAPLVASGMVTVPEVLSANADDGVSSQAELIDAYPEAARAALGAARDAAAAEGGNPLASFLAEQLGARSVTPREGDSTDAILSRVEAAVKGGDLDTALNEISTLPEPAQAALQDWVTRTETRAAALAATDALSGELDTE